MDAPFPRSVASGPTYAGTDEPHILESSANAASAIIRRDLAFVTLLSVTFEARELHAIVPSLGGNPGALVARARQTPDLENRLYQRLEAFLGPQCETAIEPLIFALHTDNASGLLQVIWQAAAHPGLAWNKLEGRAVRRLHHLALRQLGVPSLGLAAK